MTCLLWSTAFFTVKIGLQYTNPLHFAGIRFMLSGLLLMIFFLNFRKYAGQVVIHWKFILKVAVLQTGILYFLFYKGIDMVPANIAAVISGAGPLFVSLLAHFFLRNERLSLLKGISITLGIIGIILISADRFSLKLKEAREFWGIMILVLANISSSMGNIVVAGSKKRDVNPVVLNSVQLFIGGLMLYLLSLFMEGPVSGPRPFLYYASLFWLVCISAVAYTIWFGLIRRSGVKVSELNVWKFMIPVFGAIFSWILLPDEYPETIVVMGMIIITLALLLLYHTVVKKAFFTVKQNIMEWWH
ncbi:MAG: DMT family transporter [Bacteroidales bacterium]|nr:DMT family transporter [Bacteroidales bacterium]